MYLYDADQQKWKLNLALEFSEGNYEWNGDKQKHVDRLGPEAKRVLQELEGAKVLYSMNDPEGSYEDSILVLFERDGKLYEVQGSHCSCNGFEGQWKPGAVTVAYYEGLFKKYDEKEAAGADYNTLENAYFIRGDDLGELRKVIAKCRRQRIGLEA